MRIRNNVIRSVISLLCAIGIFYIPAVTVTHTSPYPAAVEDDQLGERIYSPYAGRSYPDQVLFGDAHFHTNLSFDAGLIGTRLDMDAGYRFARGEKVISNTGQPVRLIRPLDFLVITDHAEMIGLAPMLQGSDPNLLADPWGKWAYERFNAGLEGRQELFANIIELSTVKGVNPFSSNAAARSIWLDFVEKADSYNEPGRFSAMTGFPDRRARTSVKHPFREPPSKILPDMTLPTRPPVPIANPVGTLSITTIAVILPIHLDRNSPTPMLEYLQ